MKKAVLFSMLALTASVFGDEELVAAAQKMNNNNNNNQQQKMNDNMMMNMVTLTSARPESENGWYLFADVLYWHVDIGSTDWANETLVSGSNNLTSNNQSLDFKWNWGFKAGIGANIDHDMWDTNFYYTWFDARHSNNIGSTGYVVNDALGLANYRGTLTTGSSKWNVHFSMFDWELGRWSYLSKNLALRPHAGIKGGWIHETVSTTFANPAGTGLTVSEKLKNRFWGVGPSAGLNSMWVLGSAGSRMNHRFSLLGDFAGAIMYGHFEDTYEDSVVMGGVTTNSDTQKGLNRNLAATMLQTMLGLSWDVAFNNDRCHFMFKVGYEFQYWFNQNQLAKTFASTTNVAANGVTVTRHSDDLSLQGVTAEVRFDF